MGDFRQYGTASILNGTAGFGMGHGSGWMGQLLKSVYGPSLLLIWSSYFYAGELL